MGKKSLLITSAVAAGLIIGTVVSYADSLTSSNQPGSVGDPVVTKSYVDQSVETIVKNELAKQNVDEAKIRTLIKDELAKSSGGTSLIVVPLQPGETLLAGAGTEFIVRTGKTIAFSADGNGIPDVTGGKDIANGQAIVNNHLLIFPREGRGIKPAADVKGTVYVMVRGSYTKLDKDGNAISS